MHDKADWSQDYIDAAMDDGECPVCGGTGVIEGECTCMDDTCCCLNPTPPDCPHCAMSAKLADELSEGAVKSDAGEEK